jgi:hypothetical protein
MAISTFCDGIIPAIWQVPAAVQGRSAIIGCKSLETLIPATYIPNSPVLRMAGAGSAMLKICPIFRPSIEQSRFGRGFARQPQRNIRIG